jgi:hypothetical protein
MLIRGKVRRAGFGLWPLEYFLAAWTGITAQPGEPAQLHQHRVVIGAVQAYTLRPCRPINAKKVPMGEVWLHEPNSERRSLNSRNS